MLTEREIEQKLKENIAPLFQNPPRIVGAWDVAEDGDVKGSGDASSSVIALAVGLRSYASFCEPQADFPCSMVLSVRREAAPTGAKLAELIEPLMNKLHVWNEDCDQMCEDLNTTQFNAGGFQLDGGQLNQSEDGWTVTLNFTLRGIVSVTQQTNN